ncbi:hypothetical protein LUZ63_012424 [Rhynchospora breviuscula]|uniref:F-box domain-containing protein n=1 Tax=Rhynchospora breviuscula TaxID=2022672 RepID=A0A9Q0HRD8_9POAL|nr:hypothetical protein LUZ63_012424 [Rhynchospora breviuscula]
MDWAGLPPELLKAILLKLIESTDHLRFCCVCRSWRDAGKSHPVPTSSIPWLHLPQDLISTVLKFYSLSENRIYEIPFPDVYYSHVIGSASGFFLVVGYGWNAKVMIINPFTGTRAHLPYTPRLSTNPVWDYSGSVIVAGLGKGCGDFGGVAYCRPGDHTWTIIESLSHCRDINEIVYKAGYFHLLEYRASEAVAEPGNNHSGDIFVNYNFNNKYISWISVFFNPNDLEEPSWSKVADIGNYALFYGNKLRILSKVSRDSGLRNTVVQYKPRVKNMPTPSCYIYAQSLGDSTVKPKGIFSCSKRPYWILPRFDTANQ